MKTIAAENLIDLIKKEFPSFIPYWEEDVRNFGTDQGITILMIPFGECIIDIIKSNNETEVKRIFEFVEFSLCNGDEEVQNAIATGLLEYLLHQEPEKLNCRAFVKYLGKESIAYCRAWDEFTGVRTEGLWGDNKQTDQ